MINIYFDMDGVLCEFKPIYKEYCSVFAQNPNKEQELDLDAFKNFVQDEKFETLPKLEKGIELLNAVHNICYLITRIPRPISIGILSSTASGRLGKDFGIMVAQQKTRWLINNVEDDFPDMMDNVNFVEYKGKKRLFATPNSILIDDLDINVSQFTEDGGYGIKFNSESDVIKVADEVVRVLTEISQKQSVY